MLKEYIDQLRPIIIDYFSKDTGGHDIGHLERTMKLALYIQKMERKGDKEIIGIASFLHDIHRMLQNEIQRYVSPKDSLELVNEILSKIDISERQKEKICFCIKFHEEYNWNEKNVSDIDTLILQDADNLDALGAIGIARTFAYGGKNGIPIFVDTVPLNSDILYVENEKDISTIHHFYHKLLLLGDNMNTKSAKIIAQKRVAYMRLFIEEFMNEWEMVK